MLSLASTESLKLSLLAPCSFSVSLRARMRRPILRHGRINRSVKPTNAIEASLRYPLACCSVFIPAGTSIGATRATLASLPRFSGPCLRAFERALWHGPHPRGSVMVLSSTTAMRTRCYWSPPIAPPSQSKASLTDSIQIAADVKYLICRRDPTTPAKAHATLSLPLRGNSANQVTQWNLLFVQAKSRVPNIAPFRLERQVSARSRTSDFILSIDTPAHTSQASFFSLKPDPIRHRKLRTPNFCLGQSWLSADVKKAQTCWLNPSQRCEG